MTTFETRLSDLLLQWEDRRLQGEDVAVTDLCADSPDLLDELVRRIRVLEALDQVLAVTPAGDPTRDASTAPFSPLDPRATKLPTVPGYEALGKLGEGGMGVVYKVRNLAMGRVEALKMMRASLAPTAQISQRFQKEIRATAHLEHPRIVRVYAAGEHRGQPYFTMEFVESGSLARHLRHFQDHPQAAAALLAKVARAVHFLHTRHILHRDLKPGNILLKEDEPLVSDFGLARFYDEEFEVSGPAPASTDPHLTQTGDVMGTLVYMSPEQAAGQIDQLSASSDVWALGIILYELLTGQRPFIDPSPERIRERIRTVEPTRPRVLQPRLDPNLEAICLKCLEKDPLRRYPSAEELAIHLERWLGGEPILPERWPRRFWRSTRRHPTLATAVALFLAFVAALAVMTFGGRPDNRHDLPSPEETVKQRAAAAQASLDGALADLKAGRTATLIPPVGPPVWYDWARRDALDSASDTADRPFTVHGDDVALLELLPRVPVPRYRLRLEVHHDGGDRDGTVGIYFAHSRQVTPQGLPVHCFCGLSFNDLTTLTGQEVNQLRMSLHLIIPSRSDRFTIHRARLGVATSFKPAGLPAVPSWRTLEMVVTPEKINVTWERQPLKELPRAELDKMAEFLRTHNPVPPVEEPRFLPEEGLGLFVYRGSAWFRSCTIEPLLDH